MWGQLCAPAKLCVFTSVHAGSYARCTLDLQGEHEHYVGGRGGLHLRCCVYGMVCVC